MVDAVVIRSMLAVPPCFIPLRSFSPPHPRMPNDSQPAGPTAIGRLMSRLLARTGYDREQAASGLVDAWQQAVPEHFRAASQPGLVRRGVLEVFVTHSALVQEMGFHKRQALSRLAELVPSEGITDIRCRLLSEPIDRAEPQSTLESIRAEASQRSGPAPSSPEEPSHG
jgi:hypothetical protein